MKLRHVQENFNSFVRREGMLTYCLFFFRYFVMKSDRRKEGVEGRKGKEE